MTKHCESHHRHSTCHKDSCIKKISPKKFLSGKGYVIDKPGLYRLCCDVTFSPAANGISAITINANDVDLSLAGFTLSQSVASMTADNFGVLIVKNAKNVNIHDGNIVGFSASSIKGQEGLTNINISNMDLQGSAPIGARLVTEAGAAGIYLAGTLESINSIVKITNVLVHDFLANSLVIADQSVRGIWLVFTNDVTIADNRVYNMNFTGAATQVFPPVSGVYGYSFLSGSNYSLLRNVAEDFVSNGPNDSDGLVTSDAIGFLSTGTLFDAPANNFVTKQNTVSGLRGTRRAIGFEIAIDVHDYVVEDNVAQNNLLFDINALGIQSRYGIEVLGAPGVGVPSRITMKNNKVLDMHNGISISSASDVLVQFCTVVASDITDSTANIFGIRISGNDISRNVTVEDSIIQGFQGAQSTAPDVLLPTNGVGISVIALSTTPGDSLGINIRKNKVIRCNGGIVLRSGQVNGDTIVDSNEVAFNTIIGIENTASPTPTVPPLTKDLIIRNLAYNNGVLITPQYPQGSQYAINTGNTVNQVLFQTNQASQFPPFAANNASLMSNYDLRP